MAVCHAPFFQVSVSQRKCALQTLKGVQSDGSEVLGEFVQPVLDRLNILATEKKNTQEMDYEYKGFRLKGMYGGHRAVNKH